MGRAPCCEKDSVKRGPWTPEEDAKLLACVAQHGTGSWRMLPKKAGLQRCGKSCRLRWTNYLRPDLKHGRFSDHEEQTIVRLHAALGSRWSLIAAQLPGRTDNDVKNYWNTRLKKKLCEMGIDPITHKPISQLLADLAGSMQHGTMASTTPTTSTMTSSSSPTSTTITEAALGCFKDDMLNVIMRRNPRMASLPSSQPQGSYYNSTNIQNPYYTLNPSTPHVTSSFPRSQSHYNVSSNTTLMPPNHGQQNHPHFVMDILQPPSSDIGAGGTNFHKSGSITNTNLGTSNYSKINTTSSIFFTSSTSSTMMHRQKSDNEIHNIIDPTPVSSLSTLSHEPSDNQGKINYHDPFHTNEEEDPYVVNQRGYTNNDTIFSWPTTNNNPIKVGDDDSDHDQLFLHPTNSNSPLALQLHMLNSTNTQASTYKGGNNLHIQSMSPTCTSRSSSTCSNLPTHDALSPYSAPSISLPSNNNTKQQLRASPPRIDSLATSDNQATHLSSMDTMIWDLSDLNTLIP